MDGDNQSSGAQEDGRPAPIAPEIGRPRGRTPGAKRVKFTMALVVLGLASLVGTDQATVVWTAPPETGSVDVQVTVTDDENETASDRVRVSVTNPTTTTTPVPALPSAGSLLRAIWLALSMRRRFLCGLMNVVAPQEPRQRLTNKPCHAVIASARNNDRLLELIDSGEAAWHQLQVRIQPAN